MASLYRFALCLIMFLFINPQIRNYGKNIKSYLMQFFKNSIIFLFTLFFTSIFPI